MPATPNADTNAAKESSPAPTRVNASGGGTLGDVVSAESLMGGTNSIGEPSPARWSRRYEPRPPIGSEKVLAQEPLVASESSRKMRT
jgi:hypothetical protein